MENNYSNKILFSCYNQSEFESEQIISEHTLVSVTAGTLELIFSQNTLVLKEGEIALVKRNQLLKAKKYPDENGFSFKSISITFNQSFLRKYALQNKIQEQEKYVGKSIVYLKNNIYIRSYFASLEPYLNNPQYLNKNLSNLKSSEAIELLKNLDCHELLFDFSEPFKIDLERFMHENFKFNVPLVDFAKLTGRSLSTFKRDFKKTFETTPQKWLTSKRLEEAHYLISKKNKRPSEIYYNLGFENFSHFSKIYNLEFGK